jgi:dihydroorotase
MTKPLLITGARVVCSKNQIDSEMDVTIEEGQISGLHPAGSIGSGRHEIMKAGGRILMPGGIDLETHLRDPGREAEETLSCTLRVAAQGGFTSVLALPSTDPVTDGGDDVEHRLRMAGQYQGANLLVAGALTQGLKGKELSEIGEMAAAGAHAFTDAPNCVQDLKLLRCAMEYTSGFEKPVILSGSVVDLAGKSALHEGSISTLLGLPGHPESAEVIAVGHHIELARLTKARVHLGAISSGRAARMVEQAKKDGLPVTAAVQPWHLKYDETIHLERRYDTQLNFDPPLRTVQDRDILREGVHQGWLMVSTGHAPLSPHHKEVEFSVAARGSISLPTCLPLLFQEDTSATAVVRAISQGPAEFLDLEDRGHISVGARADLCIFNPTKTWRVSRETLGTQVFNSPLLDIELEGCVELTLLSGKIAFQNSTFQL